MNTRLALPAMFTLAIASLPAQERSVEAVVLVRCGPSDLILNRPLVDALLNEPGVTQQLQRAFGDSFRDCSGVRCTIPAPHAAGTFQIHIEADIDIAGDWSPQRHDQAVDAVVAHLRQRLDSMLYEEPVARLEQRRRQLREQYALLQKQRHRLRTSFREADVLVDQAHSDRATIQQQLLGARLDLATEEQARKHLANLRDQNVEMRDKLRQEHSDKKRERAVLDRGRALLQDRLRYVDSTSGEAKKIQKDLAELDDRLHKAGTKLARWDELASDVRGMLTVVLEQLPQCELQLRRARARLDSLEEKRVEIAEQLQTMVKQTNDRAQLEVEAEQIDIDLQVRKQQMIEVESRLSQLEPVRYEVLRPR